MRVQPNLRKEYEEFLSCFVWRKDVDTSRTTLQGPCILACREQTSPHILSHVSQHCAPPTSMCRHVRAVRAQVPTGAWFPLALAAVVMAISCTWHWASIKRLRYHNDHAKQLPELLQPAQDDSDADCGSGGDGGSGKGSGAAPSEYKVSDSRTPSNKMIAFIASALECGRMRCRRSGFAVSVAEFYSRACMIARRLPL